MVAKTSSLKLPNANESGELLLSESLLVVCTSVRLEGRIVSDSTSKPIDWLSNTAKSWVWTGRAALLVICTGVMT